MVNLQPLVVTRLTHESGRSIGRGGPGMKFARIGVGRTQAEAKGELVGWEFSSRVKLPLTESSQVIFSFPELPLRLSQHEALARRTGAGL